MRERRRLFEGGHGVSGQGEDDQARQFENNLLFSYLFSILTNEFLLLLFLSVFFFRAEQRQCSE